MDDKIFSELYNKYNGYLIKFPEHLQEDRDIAIRCVKADDNNVKYVHPKFLDDEEFVELILCQEIEFLKYASDRLKDDTEFVSALLDFSPTMYPYISNRLKDDDEIFKKYVKKSADILKCASNRIKDNKELVLMAVKKSGKTYRYASERLRGDMDIIKIALYKCRSSLQYVPYKLQKNMDILSLMPQIRKTKTPKKKLEEIAYVAETYKSPGTIALVLERNYPIDNNVITNPMINKMWDNGDFDALYEIIELLDPDRIWQLKKIKKQRKRVTGFEDVGFLFA